MDLNDELFEACKNGDVAAVKHLTAAGADVNAVDERGNTPLHRAIFEGYRKTVTALIVDRADVNAVNQAGNTPLHLAAADAPACFGYPKIVKLLFEAGAYVQPVNENGHTPLAVATIYTNTKVANLLKKHGAKP